MRIGVAPSSLVQFRADQLLASWQFLAVFGTFVERPPVVAERGTNLGTRDVELHHAVDPSAQVKPALGWCISISRMR